MKNKIIVGVILAIVYIGSLLYIRYEANSDNTILIDRLSKTETEVRRQKEDSVTIASKYGEAVSNQRVLRNELSSINGLYQQLFKEKSAVEKDLKKSKEYIAALITINRNITLERDSIKASLLGDKYTGVYTDKWVDLDQSFDSKSLMFGFKLKIRDEMKLVLAGQEAGYLRIIGISSNPYVSEQQTFKLSYDPEKFSNTKSSSYLPWGLVTDTGLVILGWFMHSLSK